MFLFPASIKVPLIPFLLNAAVEKYPPAFQSIHPDFTSAFIVLEGLRLPLLPI